MKLVVITQEDRLVIPENLQKILAMRDVEIVLIATTEAKGAFKNSKATFVQGFGLVQSARMAFRLLIAKTMDMLDAACAYRLLQKKQSIKSVAGKYHIPFISTGNPNDESFLSHLEDLAPDLIVSLSAPCIFRPKLLAVPSRGCINLHCSLLPLFAGYLPSFWVLYHGATETGATVHYMDSKIDNGDILGQVRVGVEPGISMFDLIKHTKRLGGELLVKTIDGIRRNDVEVTPNDSESGTYFPPPTIEQMKEFRTRGGRFV